MGSAFADGASDGPTCSSLESSASLCLAAADGCELLHDRFPLSAAPAALSNGRSALGASPLGSMAGGMFGPEDAPVVPDQAAAGSAAAGFTSLLHSIWNSSPEKQQQQQQAAQAPGDARLQTGIPPGSSAAPASGSPADTMRTQQVLYAASLTTTLVVCSCFGGDVLREFLDTSAKRQCHVWGSVSQALKER